MPTFARFLCTAAILAVGTAAHAVPITYTFATGQASGGLGSDDFDTDGVVFTLNADTDDIAPNLFASQAVLARSATVSFNGKTLDIVTPVGVYATASGFGLWKPEEFNLLDEETFTVDLTGETSEVATNYEFLQWEKMPLLSTTEGSLLFDDATGVRGTFSATFDPASLSLAAVPLPAAGWLLLAALGGLAVGGRRKP